MNNPRWTACFAKECKTIFFPLWIAPVFHDKTVCPLSSIRAQEMSDKTRMNEWMDIIIIIIKYSKDWGRIWMKF